MDPRRFDRLTAALGDRRASATGRRALLGGVALLGAAGVSGAILPAEVAARNKKKHKKKNTKTCTNCCLENGQLCTKKGNGCNASFCLGAPFTIEAVWTSGSRDHDTVLFVPNQAGATLPSPFIRASCNPVDSACESDVYPFICVSQDAQGPGNEVTTVRTLLRGTYEYWIELFNPSPLGNLTVILRRANGSVVRSWSSPENPSEFIEIGWHVFDIDGATATMTSIDLTNATSSPNGAHDPSTNVCPK